MFDVRGQSEVHSSSNQLGVTEQPNNLVGSSKSCLLCLGSWLSFLYS